MPSNIPSIEPSVISRITGGIAGFFIGLVGMPIGFTRMLWEWDGKWEKDDTTALSLPERILVKSIATPFAIALGVLIGSGLGAGMGIIGGLGKGAKIWSWFITPPEKRKKEESGPLAHRYLDLVNTDKYILKTEEAVKTLEEMPADQPIPFSKYNHALKKLSKANFHFHEVEKNMAHCTNECFPDYGVSTEESLKSLPEGSLLKAIKEKPVAEKRSLVKSYGEKITNFATRLDNLVTNQRVVEAPSFFQQLKEKFFPTASLSNQEETKNLLRKNIF